MNRLLPNLIVGIFVSTISMAQVHEQWPAAKQVTADGAPSGSVTFNGGSVGAGVGYVWGHGTLSYEDKHYKFKVSGISVADVGGAKITAEGDVYNLAGLQDFSGTYSTLTAGVTVAAGGSVAYLSNPKGVIIKLHSTTQGLRFNLSADGVRITLRKS